jgi:hypothetical protein
LAHNNRRGHVRGWHGGDIGHCKPGGHGNESNSNDDAGTGKYRVAAHCAVTFKCGPAQRRDIAYAAPGEVFLGRGIGDSTGMEVEKEKFEQDRSVCGTERLDLA